MKIIPDMWQYANAAYREPKSPNDLLFVNGELQSVTGFQFGRDYAYLSIEGTRAVLAIRGSDTAGGNWKIWLNNIKAFDRKNDTDHKGIHDGFGDAAKILFEHFLEDIERILDNKLCLYITGHSRGGAIAGIVAWYMINAGFQKFSVLPFASPNWCNKEIRNQLNMAPVDITQIYTTHDMVYKIPGFFYKPGKVYELHTSAFAPVPSFLPIFKGIRGVIDHLPKTYARAVEIG